MKRSRLGAAGVLMSVLLGATASGQRGASELREQIRTALAARENAQAAELIARYLERRPDDGAMAYNGACVHCRLGDLARAETHLRQAIRAGYLRFSHMRRDPDLEPLRDRSIYRAIMAARDAADELLSRRRIDDCLQRLPGDRYALRRDETRRLDYLGAWEDTAWAALRDRVGAEADHLGATLFTSPLRNAVLIAVPRPGDMESAFPDRHVHGTYRHEQRLLVTRDVGRALRHELVHVYHHHHMDLLGQQHPMWIQEGLACLYESHRLDDRGQAAFLANGRDVIVQALAEDGRLLPWRELLEIGDRGFDADPARRYAQVRSIFLYLAEQDLVAPWYRAYTGGYGDEPTGASALEEVFGEPLDRIESRWRQWLETRPAPVEREPEPEPAAPSEARAVRTPAPAPPATVDPAAVAYDEARVASGAGDRPRAIAALERVIALDPSHADARYDLALAHVRAGDHPAARLQHHALRRLDPSLASLLGNLLE